MPTGSRVFHSTADVLFDVLADYQRYPDWSPDVVASTVLAREGDVAVAEFLSPFLMTDKYVLEFVHSRPESITYRQVDRYASLGVQGSWHLETRGGGEITVTAQMDYRESGWHRAATRRRAKLILERRLDALEVRLSNTSVKGEDPARVTPVSPLLEALASGEPFRIWSPRGRYVLTRIDA